MHAMFAAVREELKSVLLKDLMRKIEAVAFEKLEKRWKERVKSGATQVVFPLFSVSSIFK